MIRIISRKRLNLMKTKKGQIDKIITAFPVMLLVFLLMAVFIFLSVGAKGIKQPAFPGIILGNQFSTDKNILLSEIELDGKSYALLEGLFLIGNNVAPRQSEEERVFYSKFTPEIVKLAGGNCLILLTPENYIFVHNRVFDLGSRDRTMVSYREAEKIQHLDLIIDGKKSFVEYYYGGCLK